MTTGTESIVSMQSFLVERIEIARAWTRSLIADIEPERWFEMPAPGVGHVAWQLGHLAVSQVALIHMRCFDKPLDACIAPALRDTFGRGSTPIGDPSAYPAADDVRALFDSIQHEAVELIRGLPDAELDAKPGVDPHPLFHTKAGAINTAAMHETFHAGQIAMMRRIWGRAPLR